MKNSNLFASGNFSFLDKNQNSDQTQLIKNIVSKATLVTKINTIYIPVSIDGNYVLKSKNWSSSHRVISEIEMF